MTLTRDLALGLIRRGSNGAELLQILDVIVAEALDNSSDTAQAEVVEAWLIAMAAAL